MVRRTSFADLISVFGGRRRLGAGALRSYLDFDRLIHDGLPVRALRYVLDSLGQPEEKIVEGIGLSRTTLSRRKQAGRLGFVASERAVRLGIIVVLGKAALGSTRAVGCWLLEPNDVLGGAIPIALLQTGVGARQVEAALGRSSAEPSAAAYDAARRRAEYEDATEPRAANGVSCSISMLTLPLRSGVVVILATSSIPALKDVHDEAKIANVVVEGRGRALRWPDLDVDLSVSLLLADALPIRSTVSNADELARLSHPQRRQGDPCCRGERPGEPRPLTRFLVRPGNQYRGTDALP
jgi:putative toxin-antitoxin system antitoxin component (TIGR02293 family)